MTLRFSLPSAFGFLVLAGCLASTPLAAQVLDVTTPDSTAPTPVDVAPQAAPAVEQPSAAFNASPAKSATKKTAKKKRKKHVTDFRKKHPTAKKAAKKKAPLNEVDLNEHPPGSLPPVANSAGEKRGYDPSISEPSEEVMAVKNRAEQKFWNGKKPINASVNVPGGVMAEPLPAPNLNALERASSSDLSGVTFDDQPLRMPETDAFKRSIDTVGFELGRTCHSHEYFGWPLSQTEQDRVNRIFSETVSKFRLRGFSIAPHAPRSAGKDISVFTADRVNGEFNKHILGLWSAGDVGLLLLVCDTDAPSDMVAAKHAVKEPAKSKKKKSSKKKAAAKVEDAPKVEEKPKVIPGAAAAPEASATEVYGAPPAPAAPEPTAPVMPAHEAAPAAVLPPPAPVSPSAPAAPPTPPPAAMLTPATAPAPTTTTTTVTTTTPATAPASDVPPPSVPTSAPPPPAATVTATPPASPSASQGKETPSPVEPAKAPEPQGSSGVTNMPYGDAPAPAKAAPAPASDAAKAPSGGSSALTPPDKRDPAKDSSDGSHSSLTPPAAQ